MAEIAGQAEAPNPRALLRCLEDGEPGSVPAAVVDEDDLVVDTGRIEDVGDGADERLDVGLLVEHRRDDAELDRGSSGVEGQFGAHQQETGKGTSGSGAARGRSITTSLPRRADLVQAPNGRV